jgi:3-hydroxy acid dehydrogenase / malonic semialdehyde reductase
MKTVIITGASSGIGLACAIKMAKTYRLVLCARNIDNLREKIDTQDSEIYLYKADVTKETEVQKIFEDLNLKNIIPDILINSAGVALGLETIDEGKIEDWKQVIDTNITGLLIVSKFALQEMKKQNSGHIINMGSIAGINTYAKGVVYAATKSAVRSISDGLRKEVVRHDIKITNIQPGLVETNFSVTRFGGDAEKAKNVYKGIQPLVASDIADIVEYSINTPKHVHIGEITVTPLHQATVETIYKTI